MAFQIRDFHPEDSESVEFVVMSVLQEWGFLPSSRDVQELDAMQSQSPFDVFYVVEDDTIGVVGCAGFAKLTDDICELRKIYLLKKCRGQGVGKQLLQTCIDQARGRGYKQMKFEANATVITEYEAFYLSQGFVLMPQEKPAGPGVSAIYFKQL